MHWNETESCAKLHLHIFNELIRAGKVVVQSDKADSLAHTFRGILKGFSLRNHAPYSALYRHIKVRVTQNTVILENKKGAPAIDPISEKEFRVTAPTTFKEVLAAVASMLDGKIDSAAFLQVTDLDEEKQSLLMKTCKEKDLTISMTDKTVVIIK